ncbi:MAG TPA: HWE histidine kinase domain-containing protein [Rhodanobacter sp.]|nr:HWE histidine kinase domain-containing protein [Rhodanobacter sp.]
MTDNISRCAATGRGKTTDPPLTPRPATVRMELMTNPSNRAPASKRTADIAALGPASAPLIVGIGAPAGSLEAIKAFLAHAPADCGMTFVLVQHLAPEHKSMLMELLRRETDMPVAEAEDGGGAERGRLSAIIDSSQDAIILHSLDGIILAWNGAAERIFGYPAAEVVGQPMTMLLPADARDAWPKQLEALHRGQASPPRPQVLRITRSGETLDLSMLVSPVFDAKSRLIAASTVARDISDLREKEAHQEMLLHELSHRVKNTLATVQAIAMQTLSSASGPEAFNTAFQARLAALAHAHDLLMQSNWRGAGLRNLVARSLEPYRNGRQPQWTIGGHDIEISPKATLALGMVFHELATNAAKYGALSMPAGQVEVKWQVERDSTLRLMWAERDGPQVAMPERHGFGSQLIKDGLNYELDADVKLDYEPTGLRCTIDVPLAEVTPAGCARGGG